MQNGIAHNGLILLWRMREGKHLCPGKTTLSDHAVLYLPVSTFVGIRTFSSRGDMSMGTAEAGSNMTFSPSQNGTSLDLQAGLEARVRENITLGVQAGYAHSVSGNSAEGYNGQATLNVTF